MLDVRYRDRCNPGMPGVIDDLFAAVEHDPDDHTAALVLADALAERDDVRAELITVHHALSTAKKGERAGLLARELELIQATRKRLVGATAASRPSVGLGFRFGLVDRLTLGNLAFAQLRTALINAFRCPDARLLRTLELVSDDEEPIAVHELLGELTKQRIKPPPALRRLRLGNAFERDPGDREQIEEHHDDDDDDDDDGDDDDGQDPSQTEDLRNVLKTLPQLADLEINLGVLRVRLAPLVSPTLERFAWIAPRILASDLEPLAGCILPALQRFELWTGATYERPGPADDDDVGDDDDDDSQLIRTRAVTARHLDPILSMLDRQPALRELAFPHFGSSVSSLVAAIARHALARRIVTLDVSHGALDEQDADRLVDLFKAAPNLERLRIDECTASDPVRLTLSRRLGRKLVGNWADEPTRFRFVSTGE